MGSRVDNDWPYYRPTVTVADVLEAGACLTGVAAYVMKRRRQIAGPTEKHLVADWVATTAHADGSGDGDGYGYGYGDGDGYGYGDGDGLQEVSHAEA